MYSAVSAHGGSLATCGGGRSRSAHVYWPARMAGIASCALSSTVPFAMLARASIRVREDICKDVCPARPDIYGIQAVRLLKCTYTELAEE